MRPEGLSEEFTTKELDKRTTSFFGFDEIKINALMLSTIDLL